MLGIRKKVSPSDYAFTVHEITDFFMEQNMDTFVYVMNREDPYPGYSTIAVTLAFTAYVVNNLVDNIDKKLLPDILEGIEYGLRRADLDEQNHITKHYNAMGEAIVRSIKENSPETTGESVKFASIAFINYFCKIKTGVLVHEIDDTEERLRYIDLFMFTNPTAKQILEYSNKVKVSRNAPLRI